ncbi:MAG: hypothetical protein M3Z17_07690 [Gemmatimonadota bacterium]|nr:hypothetical protein [Gemmatimonadota bacterium]
MQSENTRLLQIAALVIPVIAAAAGGKWAVDATRLSVLPSASLPTSQELDSLRGYVLRTQPVAEPLKPTTGMLSVGTDPFAKVSVAEAPSYVGGAAPVAGPGPVRWVVSTIMITENRRVAVINGVLATAGTVLPGGARVLAIEPDHVVLAESSGARREVSVQSGAN